MIQILFWVFTASIIYIFFGYPLILFLFQYVRKLPITKNGADFLPVVTLFIPVYNEESVIEKKIKNSLAMDYPRELLEIVVASDASTDRTNQIVANYASKGVTLFVNDRNEGKNALINKYVPKTTGKVIAFTDANSMFDPSALKSMVKKFSDPAAGCVGGKLIYQKGKSAVAKGEGFYFKYENFIRKLEGLQGAMVGANGAIYAIQRDLFVPVPSYVPNDFYHPLTILKRDFLSVFDENAIAREKPSETVEEEFKRRARIVVRSVSAVWEAGRLFGWFKGKGGFNLLSHKILRWFAFPILVVMLLFNVLLLNQPLFKYIFVLQITFYALGILGYTFDRFGIRFRFFFVPYYFLLINIAGTVGMLNFFRGQKVATWKTASTTR